MATDAAVSVLTVTAAGLGCAMLPGLTGILTSAALIGAGTGLITPLGFADLVSAEKKPPGIFTCEEPVTTASRRTPSTGCSTS
ncbi:hypothetical protein OG594_23180 [Streptomyces sp. NBC_01214]|uniref:hypothetical protein n=1 Tax=Streptomyces sp. NBC_01214 TaxID=2903777 RepID=UPI0022543A39|nr:hypothetical protein [Streptomyces sp. NBC_01214]MCX4804501.1 hypothetical protein [Streptomyces sp. NBC_01214]